MYFLSLSLFLYIDDLIKWNTSISLNLKIDHKIKSKHFIYFFWTMHIFGRSESSFTGEKILMKISQLHSIQKVTIWSQFYNANDITLWIIIWNLTIVSIKPITFYWIFFPSESSLVQRNDNHFLNDINGVKWKNITRLSGWPIFSSAGWKTFIFCLLPIQTKFHHRSEINK